MLNYYGRTVDMEAHYDDVIAINLTTTFGAGNEPTVEQMDEIMSKFENSWFDGTKNLFRASETLKKQIAIDARTEFDAKNMVVNGDFSNGNISGWSGSPNAVYDNGRLKFTSWGQYGSTSYLLPTILNNKYYVSGYVQATTSNIGFELHGSRATHNGDGINKRISLIATDTGTKGKVLFVNDFGTSDFQPVWIDNVSVIDLTATFGAGKEPTLAEMDRLMTHFSNSWFDGKQPLNTIRNLYTDKANKVQEAWITPTLVNGWLVEGDVSVQYMKDEFGVVHIRGRLKFTANTTVAFTLPVGYRPKSGTLVFSQIGQSKTIAEVTVSGLNGNVVASATGTSEWVNISGVYFKVD